MSDRIDSTLRKWTLKVAAERVALDDVEDASQEALTAVWRVLEARPDAPRAYLVGVVKRSLSSFRRGTRVTAGTGRRGYVDAAKHVSSYEVPDVPAEDFCWDTRAWVRDAVRGLPEADRELVFARFWEGMTFPEIAERRGCTRESLERRWANHIRPALQDALGMD